MKRPPGFFNIFDQQILAIGIYDLFSQLELQKDPCVLSEFDGGVIILSCFDQRETGFTILELLIDSQIGR